MKIFIRVATAVAAVLLVTAVIVVGQGAAQTGQGAQSAEIGIPGVSGVVKLNPKADIKAAGFPPPYWAYPANLPNTVVPPDTGVPQHVPNTSVALTLTQIRDLFTPPDWHPDDHPAMPPIVGQGRKPQIWACGYCHLPTGWGKPENANVSNLPEAYFLQQVADFKNGSRRSTSFTTLPHTGMVASIMPTTDAEVKEAYEYFAKNKLPMQRYKVIETDTVPKTTVQGSWVLSPVIGPGAGKEPIGQRVVEVPDHPELTTLRDWRSMFTTYVPVGSLKKGEDLVMRGGNGKTVQCTYCHGNDLLGIGPVPPIAGRSAIYTFRQLYDFKDGVRHGAWSGMMKPVVQNLTLDDMIAIVAYTSSRLPSAGAKPASAEELKQAMALIH
jgi:cytochrome c553